MGWFRFEADAWPEIRERLPVPLTRAEALHDLRWLFYQSRSRGHLWSHIRLAHRWGWYSNAGKPAKKRVNTLIKSEGWRDPLEDARAREAEGSQEGAAQEAPKRQKGAKRDAEGSQEGAKDNGQTSIEQTVGSQEGGREEAEGSQEGAAQEAEKSQEGGREEDRRIELPSPAPEPSQAPAQKESRSDLLIKRDKYFVRAARLWNDYRKQENRRQVTLNPKGKSGTEGGSLRIMLGTGSLKDVTKASEVLMFIKNSQHERAKFYREKQLGLVAIKRHFEELHSFALDDLENPAGSNKRNAGEYEGTKDDGIDDTSEETRLWWSERIAKAKAEKQQRDQEQAQ
ncbi:MAG: hypothetical protein V3R87_12990 [Dehalococcoidia bacterium]